MASLKLRYQNQKCRIECTATLFPAFLLELEEKLKHSFFFKKGYFEAYFTFPFSLSDKECIDLFSLCDIYHTYVMEIETKEEEVESILLEHCFFNGEEYFLEKECIYIGDIDKNVHITSSESIFVVGEVRGVIDLLHKENEIHASSFKEARIRLFDSTFQTVTNTAPCKVYYENENIKVV